MIASIAVFAALTMGALVRRSRADRLEQVELALAREQAAREEHTRAAALAERARIAREVHDVLAHSLSALSLNLQGALLMLIREGASEDAQEQVRRAQRLAAEGLTEARRAVAALRDDPVPAARAIADLVTSARLESGTPTELTVEGAPRDLPGPVEDTLYRTAQEALSNTRKHAAGAKVEVVLAYRDDSTELTVTDHQGRRPAVRATGGYGLTGMRERAELIGGALATGPTDDGWQVRLVVPT
jgi:signal transduction histidine kinase